MSFRLFIYYCALCGGGVFLGWMLGGPIHLSSGILTQGLKGMCFGLSVAWALAFVDALWMFSLQRFVSIRLRVPVADRRSPAFLGDLRSADWHGRKTMP
jgi:hypothetical protein